jgi:flagellar biosynthesis/type III secretory pathway M-ring protein FliF/YscJ
MPAEQLPLHDIHLPEPISFFWPLAPGWWLLLAFVLVLILVSIWILRFRKRNAAKRFALDYVLTPGR